MWWAFNDSYVTRVPGPHFLPCTLSLRWERAERKGKCGACFPPRSWSYSSAQSAHRRRSRCAQARSRSVPRYRDNAGAFAKLPKLTRVLFVYRIRRHDGPVPRVRRQGVWFPLRRTFLRRMQGECEFLVLVGVGAAALDGARAPDSKARAPVEISKRVRMRKRFVSSAVVFLRRDGGVPTPSCPRPYLFACRPRAARRNGKKRVEGRSERCQRSTFARI